MRASSLRIPLLIAFITVPLAGTAQARDFTSDVSAYCNTYIQFDDENGQIYAQAYVYTSYVYNLYYNIQVWANLFGGAESDFEYKSSYGESMLFSQDLWVHLHLEAWADTDYKVSADYSVGFNYDSGYGYYDFWDFSRYSFLHIYAADFYDFIGYYGRNAYNSTSSTNVGTVHSGKKTGVPHHVKVFSDVNSEVPNCGAFRRIIKYQVVDANGKPVGTTKTREEFHETQHIIQMPFVNNSCAMMFGEDAGEGSRIFPSECSIDRAGIIVDGLFVGCAGGADCGASDFIDSWVTCQSGKPSFGVTSNLYHARAQEMLINGVFQYSKGTPLR